MGTPRTAAVVGSGPNGLTAAAVLARAGLQVTVLEAASEIGGGTRSAELTVPGLLHDVCSAVHPMAAASPAFAALDLSAHGLTWDFPEVDAAHPFDDGSAAVLSRDLDRTAASLGADGERWRATFAPLAAHWESLIGELFAPFVHVPRHPFVLARAGLPGLLSATRYAGRWQSMQAPALFAGLAAHAIRPLTAPGTSAVGLLLGLLGHAIGWPVARGGSRSITDALAAVVTAHGGEIVTDHPVTSRPDADLVLLDTTPAGALRILGGDVPARVGRAYQRWQHGPASFKVDLAVDGGVPWTNADARAAGTVHVGGRLGEVAYAEAEVAAGRMPQRPFVLVGQQYLADPTRSVGDVHPVWAYAHVPHGFGGDASDAVIAQIERFAPGLRERIVAQHVHTPRDLEAGNANYVGGDIAGGAATLRQLLARPRFVPDPYRISDGVYLCSAATPPGPGVHGMGGWNAAHAALRAR